MKGLCYTLLVFILLSSLSCTESTVTSAFDHAAEIMSEKPDSAKLVLDGIRRSELKNRALKARFALLYSQAMDKCYIDTDNDSLISVALKYYSNRGTNHEKALAYYYKGVVLRNKGNTEAEVNALLEAQKYASKTQDYYLNGLICNQLARLYSGQRQYLESFELYSKGVHEFEKVNSKINVMTAYLGMRSSLIAVKQYERANIYTIKAYKIAKEINAIEHIIRLGADISRHKNELYDLEIIEYINIIRENYHLFGDDLYRLYGILYELNHQLDSAKYYYTKYIDNVDQHTRISANVLSIIAKLAETTGDYNQAIEYSRRYADICDSINLADQKVIIQSLENKHLKESYNSLNKQYKLYRVIYSLIVIILFISIMYATRIYKNKLHCKQRDLESYVVQHETQYGNLLTQYNTLLKQIDNYNIKNKKHSIRIAETLKNRMESLRILSEFAYKYGASKPNKFYEKFHEHIVITNSEDDNLADDIIQAADILNNGIISYLKESYPQMTKIDLAYCGLISLGFTSESIRMICNHTHTQSLYTAKYRIRNKIRQNTINIGQDLEDYIQELSNTLRNRQLK